ncbi:hypothetical protein, conserved in T. vivax [Trypanosoma vivax Y486]|uniref:Retrotransposon hot spot (RHS) protein n=1 Tax=Trypanosoma vivax (strain Y486) TaxID=1055687 RepID=F9WU01_TRYVY|nr:hypothetical protein, conserved in T. vivax [Trypanosoma vivax Y486]|eukprot:CCD21047.1 hypothetical protein, conserved in T. vivax [Trypanosoma vivax Y486]
MAERNQLALPNEGASAGEPPLVRARLEDVPGPRWTLDSRVRDVLLDGVPPPDKKMLSECLERVGCDRGVANGNIKMDIVIQEPEQFIPDENTRRRILSLHECQTYALVYKVVPLLRGEGITSVGQWGGADENTDAKRAVKDGLADERLWNTTRGLLDAAYNVAKDAEAREKERIGIAGNVVGEVIAGAFESVFEATWSHVLSGQEGSPLGMRVVDGLPENVWSDAEVNRTPLSLPTENVDDVRNDGLELLVLTSKKGWPYTKFDVPNNANLTPLRMMRTTDVVVRREVVRVWNIVRADLDAWLLRNNGEPTPFVLVGSPGIGKSFGVGSYLLYELLHYAPDKLDVVAYLVHDRMYIFYLPRGGEVGRVERCKKNDGVERVMQLSDAGKRGYMILDVEKDKSLPTHVPSASWGSIVLSSPNEENFRVWCESNTEPRFLYINRYHAREMKAYFAWMRRADIATADGNAAVRTELEVSWRTMEKRMHEVGHAPRYVFNNERYEMRKNDSELFLNEFNIHTVFNFLDIFAGKKEWKDDDTIHTLVDLVRLGDGAVERCGNRPVSVEVRKKMIYLLRQMVVNDPRIFNPDHYSTSNGTVFEILVLAALQRPVSAGSMLRGVKTLKCGTRRQRRSVVETFALAMGVNEQFTFRRVEYLYNCCRPEKVTACEPMVLYRNYHDNYPVIDGFFVVENYPDQAVVLSSSAVHRKGRWCCCR